MGVGGQPHAPADSIPGKALYPFYRRLGGPQGRPGWAGSLVPTGIRSGTVQPVAQSLYRLSYRAVKATIQVQIMLDQKQPNNVEYFVCFVAM